MSSRPAADISDLLGPVESRKRSVVKAVSYRVLIVVLDFTVVYLLTGRMSAALGFMLVSNVYTTVAYFVHERVWTRIHWGMEPASAEASPSESAEPSDVDSALGAGRP
jgi:uncharacterized membrane protein